ncbi:TPA: hypothetical protein ACH3X1_015818 [Trebouxia sp. C0004]
MGSHSILCMYLFCVAVTDSVLHVSDCFMTRTGDTHTFLDCMLHSNTSQTRCSGPWHVHAVFMMTSDCVLSVTDFGVSSQASAEGAWRKVWKEPQTFLGFTGFLSLSQTFNPSHIDTLRFLFAQQDHTDFFKFALS